jgi:hypothetical protein
MLRLDASLLITLVIFTALLAGLSAPVRADTFCGTGREFYLLESTDELGLGQRNRPDVLLIHLSEDDHTWARTWGTQEESGVTDIADYPVALATDPVGNNVCVFGNYDPYVGTAVVHEPGCAFLLKYTHGGTLSFAKSYNWSNKNFNAQDVCLDALGNIYLTATAFTDNGFENGSQWWVFTWKCDPSGNVQWARRWTDDTYNSMSEAIGVDGAGDVWVLGSLINVYGVNQLHLFKYSGADGTLLAATEVTFGLDYDAWPLQLAIDAAGNVYVSGETMDGYIADPYLQEQLLIPNMDVLLFKFNSAAELQWTQVYGTNLPEHPYAIAIGPTGDVFVAGEAVCKYMPPLEGLASADPNTDGLLLHFDAAGPLVQASLNAGNQQVDYKESFRGMLVTGDDRIWCSGLWGSTETFLSDAFGSHFTLNGLGLDIMYIEAENEASACSMFDVEYWQEQSPLKDKAEITGYLTERGMRVGEIAWMDITPPI